MPLDRCEIANLCLPAPPLVLIHGNDRQYAVLVGDSRATARESPTRTGVLQSAGECEAGTMGEDVALVAAMRAQPGEALLAHLLDRGFGQPFQHCPLALAPDPAPPGVFVGQDECGFAVSVLDPPEARRLARDVEVVGRRRRRRDTCL